MDVLVRIKVGRIPANETTEGVKLTDCLACHGSDVVRRSYLVDGHPAPLTVDPFPKVEV
jgi:hypothetical protein